MKVLNAKNMAKARQRGFTIIELIVVILLLGILTATALPRFIDVTDEAHESVVDAVQGGLNTGAGLFRAAWFASGQAAANISQFGDGTVDASTGGYPVGTDGGTGIGSSADCLAIFEGLLQAGRPSATSADFNATAATLEGNIETAASTSPGYDFVVTTDIVPTGTPAVATGCHFYYTGQYKSGTSTTNRSIPYLIYTLSTGAVTRSATDLTLQVD